MDIKNFNESIESINEPYKLYISIISIFIVIIFFIIIKNNNFYEYYKGSATILDNKLKTSVLLTDLEKIKKNKYIEIGESTFTYKIESIDEENYVYENTFYKVVNLKLEEDHSFTNNDYISYKIIIKKDTLINYFFRTVRGSNNGRIKR